MKIAGIQKLSMVDYPGKMACTIFFIGCNFRCPYCHNSSLVIPEQDQSYMSEEEVLKFLKKRQGLLDGVCITGGEPLLQGRNLLPFIRQIRELGYSVKLDTNGTFPELLRELCEEGLVDYVAMDIKHSRTSYEKAVGRSVTNRKKTTIKKEEDQAEAMCMDNLTIREFVDEMTNTREVCQKESKGLLDKIEESVRYLMQGTIDYEFRTTLVKGIHEPQDIPDIVDWIGNAHIWYLQNFKDSGAILSPNSCKMEPFSENELNLFANTANEMKLNTVVRNV